MSDISPTLDAFLRSWPREPWLCVVLLVTAVAYGRGWVLLRSRGAGRWRGQQLAAFLAGLAAIFLALASPIEPFAGLLLQAHMVQHALLMMVAPPLLWLGEPLFPLLAGLPRMLRRQWAIPLLRSEPLRNLFASLTHPLVGMALLVGMTWFWHIPAIYDAAMRDRAWHELEHACFFGSAMLFWFSVAQPYPSRPRWSPWLLPTCLILADVSNTLLSALLTFSNRMLYPYYAEVPRIAGVSALDDQANAGVIMWVPGSIAFLVPVFWIGVRLLYGEQEPRVELRTTAPPLAPRRQGSFVSLPVLHQPATTNGGARASHRATSVYDLLRLPLLGRLLRWRHARLAFQMPLALLAAAVIYDGLCGPQITPLNLAGVAPWIHWRGLLVLGMLAVGNVFCMACPFTLPRTLARRWLPARRSWPRPLRNKWLAVGLLMLFLWGYEALSLWDSPWWTAWIAIGYFVAAIAVDGFFQGGAFCKYVCPIGQFNFVQSLVSPCEIKVRAPDICATCQTKDCIRGRDGIPGCELQLFQPKKLGNLDCTFCLDCVHACPHENVGMLLVVPGAELWRDPPRSGIGRWRRRPDLAALVLVLVFGAFGNAAGMVAPVVEWQERFAKLLGGQSRLLVTSLYYAAVLVAAPLLSIAVAATWSRRYEQSGASVLTVATRYSITLAPLGFGMWLAHYSFHLLTSFDAVIPATQRFASDLGLTLSGEPTWISSCCRKAADWVPLLEITFIDLGFLLSLYSAYRVALERAMSPGNAAKAFVPWGLLMLLLFAMGIWIVFQPMQMRGSATSIG